MSHDAHVDGGRMATGTLTLLCTLAGWSAVPLFLAYFAKHIDFWTSNGWRYGTAALIWAPVLIIAAANRRMPPGLWKRALVPAAINCMGQVAFTAMFYEISAGLATFGLRVQIIFVAIGAYLLFPSERALLRRPGFWVGMVLVGVGTGVTLLSSEEPIDFSYGLGVALSLLAGAGFAGYGLAVRKFLTGIHPVTAFAAISQYTALCMVTLMLVFGEQYGQFALALSPSQFLWLILSAIIGIALGHVFYYISLARIGVAVTSGVLQLQPFCVAIASSIMFAEHLSALQWTAGAIAVAGAIVMLWIQAGLRRRAKREIALPPGPGASASVPATAR